MSRRGVNAGTPRHRPPGRLAAPIRRPSPARKTAHRSRPVWNGRPRRKQLPLVARLGGVLTGLSAGVPAGALQGQRKRRPQFVIAAGQQQIRRQGAWPGSCPNTMP